MQPTKRARTIEAKQERVSHILATAADILDTITLNAFTVGEVANRTKLSKPAIYNYFPTKEEILLELYRDLLRSWIDSFSQKISTVSGNIDKTTFDEFFVETFMDKPLLAKLTPQLTSTLEQNVTIETYNAFKLETAELTKQFAGLLVHCNCAKADNSHQVALAYMTILAGAIQIAAPVPFERNALDRGVMSFIDRTDFKTNCLNALQLLG